VVNVEKVDLSTVVVMRWVSDHGRSVISVVWCGGVELN